MQISDEHTKIVHPELSYKLTGLLFSVHNKHGKFCREIQYANELEKMLLENKIPYVREYAIPETEGSNIVDFLIDGKIILEIKAKQRVTREDYLQIMRYLRAANLKLGLLVNFRASTLRPKRILNSQAKA